MSLPWHAGYVQTDTGLCRIGAGVEAGRGGSSAHIAEVNVSQVQRGPSRPRRPERQEDIILENIEPTIVDLVLLHVANIVLKELARKITISKGMHCEKK